MKRLLSFAAMFVVLGCGGCKVPKTSYVMTKAKVLRVYEVNDGGFKHRAYVVDRRGTEVVVTDATAKSSHKVGDTIEYLDQKIDLPGGPKVLNFSLLK